MGHVSEVSFEGVNAHVIYLGRCMEHQGRVSDDADEERGQALEEGKGRYQL